MKMLLCDGPEIAAIAADLRHRAQQAAPPYSTSSIIEHCFPSAFVTGGALPSALDELMRIYPEGAVIVYKRSLSIPEQRFAIAHALAHLMFDGASSCMRPGCAGDPQAERRADAFASELLVPLEKLRQLVEWVPSADAEEHEVYLDHVDMLASRFAVPQTVIDQRIRDLIVTHKFVSR